MVAGCPNREEARCARTPYTAQAALPKLRNQESVEGGFLPSFRPSPCRRHTQGTVTQSFEPSNPTRLYPIYSPCNRFRHGVSALLRMGLSPCPPARISRQHLDSSNSCIRSAAARRRGAWLSAGASGMAGLFLGHLSTPCQQFLYLFLPLV